MKDIKLSKRLSAAAELCRDGSFIADVGTDHAYLPIFLANKGKIRGGVVSDINRGPIERARAHIAEAELGGILTPLLCDGLSGLEKYLQSDRSDIFILGMGGELIARIISDAPFVKKEGVRLILQPMTHPEILRRFLLDNGFSIVAERLVREEKIYQLFCAEYSGKTEEYSRTELMFGKLNIEKRDPLLPDLLCHTEKVMTDRIKGKRLSGADTSDEEFILKEIEKLK